MSSFAEIRGHGIDVSNFASTYINSTSILVADLKTPLKTWQDGYILLPTNLTI
jgi:hypothetical protein